jgi:hypothetical protein
MKELSASGMTATTNAATFRAEGRNTHKGRDRLQPTVREILNRHA